MRCLRNIAMRDYEESVTNGQTHTRTHAHTDRQTLDRVIPMSRFASQATQKSFRDMEFTFFLCRLHSCIRCRLARLVRNLMLGLRREATRVQEADLAPPVKQKMFRLNSTTCNSNKRKLLWVTRRFQVFKKKNSLNVKLKVNRQFSVCITFTW